MSEAFVLSIVERYPHPTALARRARNRSVFATLRCLEARGLLRRQHDRYRLTQRGREELAMTRALIGLVLREP
jgi:DNA-binding PadR family transcriptional regulator